MLKEAISKMPEVFEPQILLRGQDYFHKGQVLNIRLSDGLLKGRVKGSSSQIYDIHMDLKTWPGKPSRCTCAYQQNCKHAAACLFALRDREQSGTTSQQPDRLDRKLDTWLKNLRAQEDTFTKKNEATHHLNYIVTLKLEGYEHKVSIELALAKLLKRGGYGKRVVFNSLPESKKQHFTGDDNDIVAQLLFKCGVSGWFDRLTIRNSELLARIISSGRAFFDLDAEEPIQIGEEVTGICQWVLSTNGNQNLLLMHENKVLTPLLLDECWYFNNAEAIMGRLNTPYPVKQLRHLLEAPPIPLEQAKLLASKMATTCPEFPTPQVFEHRQMLEIKPTPVLILDALGDSDMEASWLYDKDEEINALFIVKIAFDYSGLIIAHGDESVHVVRQQRDTLLEYKRDINFETLKLEELHQLISLRPVHKWELHALDLKEESLLALNHIEKLADLDPLYNQAIPQLKNRGWRIEFANELYQEIVSADDVEWYSDLRESTTDFFSYQLGILVEGQQVSVVPLVAALIQRYSGNDLEALADTQLVKLPLQDGRALQLQMGRIKPLIRLLLQFGTRHVNEQEHLQINKYQLLLMQEVELAIAATKARWQGAEQFRQELKQLIHLTELPDITPPPGLKVTLRDYQHYGLKWLQFLRTSRFNGILADDMGLGKTVQTLAHLQYEKEQGRLNSATLIIAPTSLVGNWLAEAKRFTPELNVLVYHGSERHQDNFDDFDLVISTYGLIHRDKEKFVTYPFYYLILDEAQFIKNARTKTTPLET